jgi:TRAP-type C4-dicarboxylate transport system permease small subunit
MRSFVGACLQALGHIVDYVLILLMALLLCVVTVGMTTRYVVPGWFVWSDELTRFTLVWVTFVGATAALRRSMHIGVDIFVNLFKPSIRRSLTIISTCLIVLSIVLIAVYSISLFRLSQTQLYPALRIPIAWVYAIMPISAVLMGLFALETLFGRRERTREGEADQ